MYMVPHLHVCYAFNNKLNKIITNSPWVIGLTFKSIISACAVRWSHETPAAALGWERGPINETYLQHQSLVLLYNILLYKLLSANEGIWKYINWLVRSWPDHILYWYPCLFQRVLIGPIGANFNGPQPPLFEAVIYFSLISSVPSVTEKVPLIIKRNQLYHICIISLTSWS